MIKNTDSVQEIKAKLLITGVSVGSIILALVAGAGENAPLAGVAGLAAAVYFLLKKEQKRRVAAVVEEKGK